MYHDAPTPSSNKIRQQDPAYFKQLTSDHPHVYVGHDESGQRALFAAKALEEGSVVLMEKPLAIAPSTFPEVLLGLLFLNYWSFCS